MSSSPLVAAAEPRTEMIFYLKSSSILLIPASCNSFFVGTALTARRPEQENRRNCWGSRTPVWRKDGKEIVYLSGQDLLPATVEASGALS
jgi:hypothetical protein